MLILAISDLFSPYCASKNSSKIESSKVFEHMSPMDSASRRPTLPALRALITTGAEAWQPIPTRAIRSAPPATASA